jgi:transposase
MRPQRAIPEADLGEIKKTLKTAKTVTEYKHAQVLYLRGFLGHTKESIASVTQYSTQRVQSIIGGYFKRGLSALKDLNKPRPRKWGLMTFEEEKAFISEYLDRAKGGEIIEVKAIQKEYEARIKKETSSTVIYNLLHRHNWRKIAPRPAHPKKDPAKAEAFKKTSAN